MKLKFWSLATAFYGIFLFSIVNGSLTNKLYNSYTNKQSKSGIKYLELDQVIVKPPGDTNNYSSIKLKNGFFVVIVSNPDSTKGSISCDVNGVGWALDPKELPGLANLVQRMLLYETSDTGDDGDYQKFIKENSGATTGAVSRDNTRLQLQVPSDKLMEAIVQFSKMLTTFEAKPNQVSRAVEELEFEFKSMVNDDEIRLKRMQLHYTDDEVDTTFDKFYQGNLESLFNEPTKEGILVDEAVNKFFKQHYLANRMRLVVHSPHPVEEVEQLIIAHFSELPNGDLSLRPKFTNPINEEYEGVIISLIPKGKMRRLVFEFVIPNPYLTPSHSAADFLINILHSKFGDSMFSKGEHYHGPKNIQAKVSMFFEKEALLEISLFTSDDGIESRYYIISLFFDVIHFIRDKAVWEHIFCDQLMTRYKLIHDEKPSDLEFNNQLLDNIFRNIPTANIIQGRFYPTEFDRNLILEMLSYIVPSKLRVFKVAPIVDDLDKFYDDGYFGLNYTLQGISKSVVKEIEERLQGKYTEGVEETLFDISHVNPFSLNKASIESSGNNKPVDVDTMKEGPKLLEVDGNGNKLWYQSNSNLPTINILLRNAQQIQSPKSSFQFRILYELIKDTLNPIFEDAIYAKHKIGYHSSQPGYILKNSGPRENIIATTHLFIDRIRHINIYPGHLEYHKKITKKMFQDNYLDPMYVKISGNLVVGLVDDQWSFEDYIKVIDDIDVNSIIEFKNQFISSSRVELLVGGPEISVIEAKSMFTYASQVFNNLAPRTLLGTLDNMKYKFSELPMGEDWIYKTYRTKHNYLQSAIGFYLAINHPSSLRPGQAVEYPNNLLLAYRKLTLFLFNSVQFDNFVTDNSPPSGDIQPNSLPLLDEINLYRDFGGLVLHKEVNNYPAKMESDMELLINHFHQFIKTMYVEFVPGAAEQYSEILKEEFSANPLENYWESILSDDEDFGAALELVEAVKGITSQGYLKFIEDYLLKGGKHRSKLALHMNAKVLEEFNPNIKRGANSELIEDKSDITELKRKWKLNYMIDSE